MVERIACEKIRLADGRSATLSAVHLPYGGYEVMVLPDGENGEELDSTQTATEAEAQTAFQRLRNLHHVPELSGRYKKLASDLSAALAYGLERKGEDDGGVSNFDAPALYLPRWDKKKVEAAAKAAGLGCFIWNLWGSKSYVFSIREGVGQGETRTKTAEAMREYLLELGYDATLYCQAD